MSTFLDYDPVSGIAHYMDYDEATGDASIHTVQDIEPVLEYNKRLKNDSEQNLKTGVRKGWWLYAKVPAVVELKMRAKGINLRDPTATKRIMQEINEHYPACKVTEANHGGIRPKLFIPGVPSAE